MRGAATVGLVLDYNDPDRTRACVESLLAAGVPTVVVWDNSDRLLQDADRYGSDSRIRIAGEGANLGFAAGANRGIAVCRALWPGCRVLLVNNDAIVASGLPARLAAAMDADGGVALAFPAVRQGGHRVGWMWYQPLLALVAAKAIPGAFAFASGCCQLVDPDLAGDAPFDEAFFMYGEDVALSWRLRSQGWRVMLVEDVEVEHEGSASARNGSLFYESMMVACHLRLASVLGGGSVWRRRLLLSLRMVVLPMRAIVRALRFRSVVPILAFIDVLRARRVGSGRANEA